MMRIRDVWRRYKNVRQPVRHALYKGAEIIGGLAFLSGPGQLIWRWRLKALSDDPLDTVRPAVVAHVYYLDLVDAVVACWAACPANTMLHITTPQTNVGALAARFASEPRVQVHVAENRGRDIAPFLALLNAGTLDGYDAVLKLHTKRSTHLLTGEHRRRLLFSVLAGNSAQVRRILALFASNPAAGLVGWRLAHRTNPRHWGDNEARTRTLMLRIRRTVAADAHAEIAMPAGLSYFEGSMFWFRPKALAPLMQLGLVAADFEAEAGQLDGALQHAIERIFTWTADSAGFETRTIGGDRISIR